MTPLRTAILALRASQSALGYSGFVARLDRVLKANDDELLINAEELRDKLDTFNGSCYKKLDDVLNESPPIPRL